MNSVFNVIGNICPDVCKQYAVSGLIKTTKDISGFDENELEWSRSKPQLVGSKSSENGLKRPLWVLNLGSDLDYLRLRRGSSQEEKDFENVTPTIKRLEKRQHRIVKKDDPRQPPKSKTVNHDVSAEDKQQNKQIKKDIMKIVNKFVLSTSREPDSYLSESDSADEPALALYFQGPYTSLTLKYGRRQWHYFIGPPSPLPAWFYRPQDSDVQRRSTNEEYKVVPVNVRNDFYKALLHLLQMFLSYPV